MSGKDKANLPLRMHDNKRMTAVSALASKSFISHEDMALGPQLTIGAMRSLRLSSTNLSETNVIYDFVLPPL
jgi:hypothetical protein